MKTPSTHNLISTIGDRCRVCYTCVRECPAKAIRIEDGQANVVDSRCIGCGNCVKVCARTAKVVRSSIPTVESLLASGQRIAAMVAPSFPAEFADWTPGQFVQAVRELGFDPVCEVSYGADLVAQAYKDFREQHPERRVIATSCPALVHYVEKYHPHLVPSLAPIVSPMIAMARVLHAEHGQDLPIVFIGPCLAKKEEADHESVDGEVAEVLTFAELREMLADQQIEPASEAEADFDPPHPGLGALFPISRGMLQAASLPEDLLSGDVVAADGRENFTQAIKEFEEGALEARLLEVLCCNGCIMGAGMTSTAPLFRRRAQVSRYVRESMQNRQESPPVEAAREPQAISLDRSFKAADQRLRVPSSDALEEILAKMGKYCPSDELNCGACGYNTCREHAIAIAKGLAESEMCLPYTIDRLKSTIHDLKDSNEQLASAQMALMQAERLASMGQLAAGIAHEVNNPLGVVLLYAHLVMDDLPEDSVLRKDLTTIVEEADRCKTIVSGLLNFARKNKLALKQTNLAGLIDRCLQVYPKPDNVTIEAIHEDREIVLSLDPDQITQVFTNFVSNAIAAMPEGGHIRIETGTEAGMCYFRVADNGVGIPPHHRNKIFEPFFTTKDASKGTGLGLAVIYGIVKMHRGKVEVESNNDPAQGPTGTCFTVHLPLNLEPEEDDDASSNGL